MNDIVEKFENSHEGMITGTNLTRMYHGQDYSYIVYQSLTTNEWVAEYIRQEYFKNKPDVKFKFADTNKEVLKWCAKHWYKHHGSPNKTRQFLNAHKVWLNDGFEHSDDGILWAHYHSKNDPDFYYYINADYSYLGHTVSYDCGYTSSGSFPIMRREHNIKSFKKALKWCVNDWMENNS